MQKIFKNFESKAGFTIIEVVVAILVLSIAIIGVYNAFSIVVILTSDTTDRFTAAYLAQEGMEIVRNIRDYNWIAKNTWGTGLTDGTCSAGCEADYKTTGTSTSPLSSFGSSGRYLYIDASGFYSYDTINGTETKFKRKITITQVSGYESHIIKVSVQVSWDEKPTILSAGNLSSSCASSNCLKSEEYLYDWY